MGTAKLALDVGGARSAWLAASLAALTAATVSCAQDSTQDTYRNEEPYCVSGSARVAPIDNRGPGLDALCPAIADALCAQWARCGCGVSDVDLCRATVLAECVEFVDPESVRDAIARRRMGWSGSQARVFLAELDSATAGCEPVDLDFSRVGVGRVADFEPCTQVSGALTECLSGSACESWFLGGPGGAPVGEYCSPEQTLVQRWQRVRERCSLGYGGVCMEGLRCAPICDNLGSTTGVCAALLRVGEPCNAWAQECESGFCEAPTHDIISNYEGRCARPFTLADGEPCVWDSSCASHHCTGGVTDRGICAPLLADGETCWRDWHCVSGRCREDPAIRIQQCRNDGAPCTEAADCPGSACVSFSGGVCAPPGGTGDTCVDSRDCVSSRCSGSVCEATVELGGECTGGDCAIGQCVGRRCQLDEQPIGAPCESRRLCASGSCVGGLCAPAVCTARVDPTGHAYYHWNPVFLTP